MYKISVLPGDGVGPEVINEGKKVLESVGDALNIKFKWEYHPYGAEHYLDTGEVLPISALNKMEKTDAIYFRGSRGFFK